MAQPKMGVVRYLLGRTRYPDNTYTRDRNGNPIRPYDMATDTMFEFMGVRVEPVDEAVKTDLVKVTAAVETAGKVPDAPGVFPGRPAERRVSARSISSSTRASPCRRVDRSAASGLQRR